MKILQAFEISIINGKSIFVVSDKNCRIPSACCPCIFIPDTVCKYFFIYEISMHKFKGEKCSSKNIKEKYNFYLHIKTHKEKNLIILYLLHI